jgi:hypothetical protein
VTLEPRAFEFRGAQLLVRPYEPRDRDACVDCFNAVFPVDDPLVPQIDARTWEWKYDPRPSGGRTELIVAEHPEIGIAGAYPCQPLRALCEGQPMRTAQITDLMVRHDWRRAGPRPGLFVTLGNAFYDAYCGAGPDRQAFNYGWPVPAWRIGQRYLRYENVRDWNFLAREIPVDPAALRAMPGGVEVRAVERFGPDVDALFATLGPRFGLTLVKDSAYLNWRFADHPSRSYRLLECRGLADGALRGVAVDTVGDFRRPNTSFVLELLVDLADDEAFTALLGACERRAREDETGAIASVFNPADPMFLRLQQAGYQVWNSSYFLVAAPFSIDALFLREAWAFTMGDSDLI